MQTHPALAGFARMLETIATLPRIFRIRAERAPELNARVAKLARRAIKLGCAPSTLRQVGVEDTEKNGVFFLYALFSSPIKLNGWTFLAALDHDPAGGENVFRARTDDLRVEAYRTAGPDCAHCNARRYRKNTYVVAHEDGRTVQVGSTCLRDFLGVDPEGAIASLEMDIDIERECEDEESSGLRGNAGDSIDRFLAMTVAVIAEYGWISQRAAEEGKGSATLTRVCTQIYADPAFPEHLRIRPTEEHVAKALLAIEWARALPEGSTGYLGNLRAACRRGSVGRNGGLVCSVVAAYDRAMADAAEAAAPKAVSSHVGTLKSRVKNLALAVVRVTSWDSDYGVVHLHTMRDAEGNVFMWKTNSTKLGEGPVVLDGTIAKHDEYKGVKQTFLSRCKVH